MAMLKNTLQLRIHERPRTDGTATTGKKSQNLHKVFIVISNSTCRLSRVNRFAFSDQSGGYGTLTDNYEGRFPWIIDMSGSMKSITPIC